ncbi:MAG: FAD-binding oxidoreductase [Longimicrobiales bacterium]
MSRPKDGDYRSWGRLYPPAPRVVLAAPGGPEEMDVADSGFLPWGNGRSYGDVCHRTDGVLLDMRPRNRILAFDVESGVLRAEAGVTLDELLDVVVPAGWFLPVSPGTRFVTLGGAIANDVHGKNHHVAGTFGRHVLALELARSDGSRRVCGPEREKEWFEATIGGLGLTGVILWAEISLTPMPTRYLTVDTTRFGDLDEFFELSDRTNESHEYTVAWVDCLARGASTGRGWMMAGNHATEAPAKRRRAPRTIDFFVEPPFSLVNGPSLRIFNELYYRRRVPSPALVDYEPFFYPLDRILNWNRMYGPRGFFQFQCVVPPGEGRRVTHELLDQVAAHRQGSFLAVLKQFGDLASPGLLSFPRPGPTLSLDFPNRGEKTRRLLRILESVVMEAGGALYPAKDAVMSCETFERSYPAWRELEALRDPRIDSDFWQRVTGRK